MGLEGCDSVVGMNTVDVPSKDVQLLDDVDDASGKAEFSDSMIDISTFDDASGYVEDGDTDCKDWIEDEDEVIKAVPLSWS